MKLSDRDFSAWQMLGFVLTAITVVLVGGWVVQSSEIARDGWLFLGWQFSCILPLWAAWWPMLPGASGWRGA